MMSSSFYEIDTLGMRNPQVESNLWQHQNVLRNFTETGTGYSLQVVARDRQAAFDIAHDILPEHRVVKMSPRLYRETAGV